ncbi:SDR family oxidoreductase [Leptospira gomenensis]|uniref:SDR family oxidoreductase n=1 Tax=Leptospira gomenensis TaxID=2484974 RepID=A0A5F1Y5P9_9LEPT|nr:SDR family NAD(P)-dependent oxidoreductase [Leptospira gomenensis]TGK28021.1 SDR family oxidoreductase [Leptospira gomenensis]TGK37124.1 SDR family oxidoreductase [Leptospira gomenensis]TGK45760.1 SDR family oxidoreductase [Leptospira gomenensis]TGK59699.1 SDR family oxidoreductase [Leptospira gomenensis]
MNDLFNVKNKTVLVTGSTRGIGKYFAEGFLKAGAVVYGTGSSEESIKKFEGTGIKGYAADIRQPDVMTSIIENIVKEHGRLDVLVNNAGIASNKPAAFLKEDEIESIIQTNFTGVFRTCASYYKIHKKKGGNIINIASILGMRGTKFASVYSGTKGAIINMTRALAVEWMGSGYRVNAICPGFIDTDMTDMIKEKPEVMEHMLKAIPMGRLGKPEDLVGAAIFLASEASSYVTGQTIVVDGGITAGL